MFLERKAIGNENWRPSELELCLPCAPALLVLTGTKAKPGQICDLALRWAEVDDVNKNCGGSSFLFFYFIFIPSYNFTKERANSDYEACLED